MKYVWVVLRETEYTDYEPYESTATYTTTLGIYSTQERADVACIIFAEAAEWKLYLATHRPSIIRGRPDSVKAAREKLRKDHVKLLGWEDELSVERVELDKAIKSI